ncbi:dihydropyrimidinase [Paenibacillus humicola]|uniref:dihydropyrimidinase n=1 Tax=Paenibacillus humicola TaxID=3110540 RepID=UPI00237BC081|nr:dihydropyrimidinase [Paenibacillus humicola]
MLDLVIRNGAIVNADMTQHADIGIKDGVIVAIGMADYMPEAADTIDAKGKYVLPGMIDSHVHVNTKLGEFQGKDDFYGASVAAVYGGTTTMVEFAIPYGDESPLDAVTRRLEEAKGRTIIDYSFHGCITRGDARSFRDVRELVTGGISSIKMFTVYKDAVMVDKGVILEVLNIMSRHGGLAKFHAENADIIDASIGRFIAEQNTTPAYHALSRPAIAEVEEMAALMTLIEHTGTPSLFVHMSTKSARPLMNAAKRRLPVFAEVCPHYLALTQDRYSDDNGENYICSPPIREQEEQDGLWEMVCDGTVDVINSDHCCYDTEQKRKYKDFFPKAPNGVPGIETRGTVLYSEGVAKGKIGMNRFVDLVSTKASKLMGLYPRKGVIKVGSDADIVVFDPDPRYAITSGALHMQTNYTPFEGLMVSGKPRDVVVGGRPVIRDGRMMDLDVRGQFVPRTSPILT